MSAGNKAMGRYEPPRIITALSIIQKTGFMSSIQNAKSPTIEYRNNERIDPKTRVRINVGTKILIAIVDGKPIIKNKTTVVKVVTTKNEYIPIPTCHSIL
jgi:hypothetical protein